MVAFLAVFEHPGPCNLSDFVQMIEPTRVEHPRAIGSAESFNVGVLVRLARFNIVNLDVVIVTPDHEALSEKLRAVVGTQHIGQSPGRLQLLEHANQAHTGQRSIDLDCQGPPWLIRTIGQRRAD